jgi:hypothetical protein
MTLTNPEPTFEESLTPLHVVTINGSTFNLRRDRYGRFRFYAATPEGLESSVGRMQGYASQKEAWDSLYQRELQD